MWIIRLFRDVLAWIGAIAVAAITIALFIGPTWCVADGCSVQGWFGALSGWAAAVAAAATINVLVATNNISRQALADNMASVERQQRAYVFPLEVIFDPTRIGDDFGLILKKRNTGLTPAYNVRTRARWVIHPASVPFPDDLPEGDMALGEIGAGQDAVSQFLVDVSAIEQRQAGLRDGTEILHLVGSITYRDAFGKPHETLFHRFMTPNPHLTGPIPLAIAPEGNSSN
jgi:hypothetical protein